MVVIEPRNEAILKDNLKLMDLPNYRKPWLLFLVLMLVGLWWPAPAYGQSGPETAEQIAFAAYKNGQWDIYSFAPTTGLIRQITNNLAEDTDPAYSPDGTRLAYASRRDENWDIYLLDLVTGQETRLTRSPHYDGAPAWHPDGDRIVFESYRDGNFDLWQVAAGGESDPAKLAGNSEAGDFAPAFHPDGSRLAFSSWRDGNKELYLLNLDNNELTRLTNSPVAEEWPAWHPDGEQLAFVQDSLGDREVFTLNMAALPVNDGPVTPITWLGRTDGPAWNPDGSTIAALFHRWDGDQIMLSAPNQTHRLPQAVTEIGILQGRLSWHANAPLYGQPLSTLLSTQPSALYQEQYSTGGNETGEPYSLVRQNDITTGTPWLADTVDESFQAWRRRLTAELGYDFLSELSDAARDVGSYTENSQYASWHKSGRAVDTLFDYYRDGQLMHEIAKENYSGETYWRIYLRCLDQSGACGRPVTANPWNYSRRARVEIAPEQGGIEKDNLAGYYVDMTAMAREYGWERISSYDDEEFGWTWNFIALEYWHYQKRFEQDGAANWYQAMQDIYPESTLEKYFSWQRMRQLDEDPHLIALKGVPLPLEMKPWWAIVAD
jgi:TolB protein